MTLPLPAPPCADVAALELGDVESDGVPAAAGTSAPAGSPDVFAA
jgi:hypothetical protein